jgi:hypothetical protein
LVARLAELYPGTAHVAEADLLESPDREIWEFAKAGNFIIVTTDSDFYELATTIGPPPKVVWLRRWTHPTPSGYCVATPSGSPISRSIRNSLYLYLTATDDVGAVWCGVTGRLIVSYLQESWF